MRVVTRNFLRRRPALAVFALLVMALLSTAPGKTLPLSTTASLNYEGTIGFDHWWFPRNQKDKPDNLSDFYGRINLTLQTKYPMEFHWAPRIFLDFDDENRSQLHLRDNLFLDYLGKYLELRAGFQTFDWRVAESRSPADFLNQGEYEVDLLEPPKLGELAVRVRIIFSMINQNVADLIYLPYFTPASLPDQTSRFDLFSDTLGIFVSNSKDMRQYQTSSMFGDKSLERWRPQAAVRYSFSHKSGYHLSLFYFNGYDRYPGLLRIVHTKKLIHQYRPVHKAGAAFKLKLGKILLKGEGVQTIFENKSIPSYAVLERDNPENLKSYTSMVFGGDFIAGSREENSHDIVFTLEGLLDSDRNKDFSRIEGFRPYRSHVFTSFKFVSNNEAERTFKAGAYINFLNPGVVYSIGYSEQLFDNLLVHCGLKVLKVHEDSDLQPIEKSMRLEAGLALTF